VPPLGQQHGEPHQQAHRRPQQHFVPAAAEDAGHAHRGQPVGAHLEPEAEPGRARGQGGQVLARGGHVQLSGQQQVHQRLGFGQLLQAGPARVQPHQVGLAVQPLLAQGGEEAGGGGEHRALQLQVLGHPPQGLLQGGGADSEGLHGVAQLQHEGHFGDGAGERD